MAVGVKSRAKKITPYDYRPSKGKETLRPGFVSAIG